MNPKILLFSAISLAASTAIAQQRTCDMEVTLVSPAEAAVIPAFSQYSVTVSIKNNGPDELLSGDTVYYNTSTMFALNYDPFVLQQGISVGGTATMTLRTGNNINDNAVDEVKSYCVKVTSNLQHTGSFIDTTSADNNRDCNEVTMKAGGTAIGRVEAGRGRLQFYPNPAKNTLYINAGEQKPETVTLSLCDVTGRVLRRQTYKQVGNGQMLLLDLEGLNPGIYLLDFVSDSRRLTGKVRKE